METGFSSKIVPDTFFVDTFCGHLFGLNLRDRELSIMFLQM